MIACEGVDIVLHQAALGSVPRSIKDPQTTNDVNISGFVNMVMASKENKIKSSLSFIKNELINNTQDLNNLTEEEMGDFDEKYKNLHEGIHSYMKDMKECREKLISLENDLKEKENENKKDITLVQTFLDFVVNLKESTEEEVVSDTFNNFFGNVDL